MVQIKPSEDLRPMSDLKSHGADIVRQTTETGRPVILTRHGRGVAVVMSLEAFEEYQALTQRAALQRAVEAAQRDMEAGHWISHEEVKAELEGWARGGED